MNNIENIKTLLSKINSIYAKVKQVDEEKRKRGEYFNVFNILGLWSEEVRLHSSFLAELLVEEFTGIRVKKINMYVEGVRVID